MLVKTAEFVISNTDYKKCPAPTMPEYAFIGRSNVGKSSLINMLASKPNLAKISQSPGKTRLINHFVINDNWYLVDLPGYGYAKTSKKLRESWEKMIRDYLLKRENLMLTFVLVDCRIPPQKNDLEFINWMGSNGLPISLIFTKSDKVSQREVSANIKTFQETLLEYWEELPPCFVTSSEKKQGREKLLDYIEAVNADFIR